MPRSQYIYIIWANYCRMCNRCDNEIAGILTVKHEAEDALEKVKQLRPTAHDIFIETRKNGLQP